MRPTRNIRVTRRTLRKLELKQSLAEARALLFEEAPIGAAAAASDMMANEHLAPLPDDDEVVLVDRPDWQTRSEFVHWDLNPWSELDFCRVQGVVAVSDHTATSGGFHCIPGFQHKLAEWADINADRKSRKTLVDLATPSQLANLQHITMRPGMRRAPANVTRSNPIQSNPIRSDQIRSNPIQSNPIRSNPIQSDPIQSNPIQSNQIQSNPIQQLLTGSIVCDSIPIGSVVIWDSRLPHGNWPNDDDTFRMVFYLTYFPSLWSSEETRTGRQQLVSYMPQTESTPLGRWVAGTEQYPEQYRQLPGICNLLSCNNLGQWGLR
jgi:ectoine hydroxylase-related dioxygenase (phytanoyl-CoA dioxygenase family)